MFRKMLIIFLMLVICAVALTGCDWIRGKRGANMANPASVYCQEQGGKLEIRKDANGGEVGICVFKDKSECDEWAFYRGECKPGDVIPGETK